MSGIWPGAVATGIRFTRGVTGVGGTGPGSSVLDLLAEVQGLVKQAGLVATKVFQHPAKQSTLDRSGNWQEGSPGAIEVHLVPGTTPEQAQSAVDEVFRKMPKGQQVLWHYDIVPLGEFDEEAERARAAFAETMGDDDGDKEPG